MKTIREWLNELPEPERSHAIVASKEQCGDVLLNSKSNSLLYALEKGFIWGDTVQGNRYWMDICSRLKQQK